MNIDELKDMDAMTMDLGTVPNKTQGRSRPPVGSWTDLNRKDKNPIGTNGSQEWS